MQDCGAGEIKYYFNPVRENGSHNSCAATCSDSLRLYVKLRRKYELVVLIARFKLVLKS